MKQEQQKHLLVLFDQLVQVLLHATLKETVTHTIAAAENSLVIEGLTAES